MRELWQMRAQVLAIGLVIVGGVGVFIMSLTTLDSLYTTQENYYREHHFAEIFAPLKRAPAALLEQIKRLPGVDKVEDRVVAYVNLDIDGYTDPVSGHLLSLPATGKSLLNQLYLRAGSGIDSSRDDQVLVSEEFALAHRLNPGDTLGATINGRRKQLQIAGLVLSPEFIYQIAPGAMFPDYERYGVLWMARQPLAAAYGMTGAFNDVSLTLTRDANLQDLIDQIDVLLKPYGGRGSYGRKDQLSNRFLTEELNQQRTIATIFPLIFFGVAAFLLNVVISRLISLQREQIATLKAFGYSDLAVAGHYSKLALAITILGIIAGIGVGVWMAYGLSHIYMEFYSLPFMIFRLQPAVVGAAIGVSVSVTLIGTLYAVNKAASLPPAEAMRPEPPALYRKTLVEKLGLERWFNSSTRMILRHLERNLLKAALTTLGISLACGIMMLGGFQRGAIDHMVWVQFQLSQRENLQALFTDPTSAKSLHSLASLEGVEYVEGFRVVPVELRFEHHRYRTVVQGIEPRSDLLRLLDTELMPIKLPTSGIVLTDYLASLLKIRPGEQLELEILEGNRPIFKVPLMSTAKQYVGVSGYMQLDALNQLLREAPTISGALLKVDEGKQWEVYAHLKQMPRIAGVVEQQSAVAAFYATLAETVLFFTFVTSLLGGSIAFGVVYNSMRIALSERHRDLASLRVLGYQVSEVAYILLGELLLLVLLAVPLGLWIGYGLCAFLAHQFSTDLYRIPLVLEPSVYAFAAAVVLASAALSSLVIWRHLRHLNLVSVLKTRE